MMFSLLSIQTIAPFLLVAVAALVPSSDSLVARQSGGAVTVGIADSFINYGSTPPWTVLDTLYSHCDSFSCTSNWAVPSYFIRSGQRVSGSLVIDAGETYIESAKTTLIEALKAASAVGDLYSVTRVSGTNQYVAPSSYFVRVYDEYGTIDSVVRVNVASSGGVVGSGACSRQNAWFSVGNAVGKVLQNSGTGLTYRELVCAV